MAASSLYSARKKFRQCEIKEGESTEGRLYALIDNAIINNYTHILQMNGALNHRMTQQQISLGSKNIKVPRSFITAKIFTVLIILMVERICIFASIVKT